MFNKVAILGLGLLGTSLARAIKKVNQKTQVFGWTRSCSTLKEAQKYLDKACKTSKEAVQNADLVVIATNVNFISKLFKENFNDFKNGAIITDVGSTKSLICKQCNQFIEDKLKTDKSDKEIFFIGSHPMAGSEKSGACASDEKLYENKTCIICPSENSNSIATQKIELFWKSLNMQTTFLDPHNHDEILSKASHLPHLASCVISNSLYPYKQECKKMCGQGLKDTTRISSGNPDMWLDIIEQNKENILVDLKNLSAKLSELENLISSNNKQDIKQFLLKAKDFRDFL